MSDAQLRALERRYQETGSVEDEATLLSERVRQGSLDPEMLALAAHLGWPAAEMACGDEAPSDDSVFLRELLRRWGAYPIVFLSARAALLALGGVLGRQSALYLEFNQQLLYEGGNSAREDGLAPREERLPRVLQAGRAVPERGLRLALQDALVEWALRSER